VASPIQEAADAKAAREAAARAKEAALHWSQKQQQQLEAALKAHPASGSASTKERWAAIAQDVNGKGVKECVARFKKLREEMMQLAKGKQA
jgi:hypothetical protein